MADQVTQQNHNSNSNNMQNDMKKGFKMSDFPVVCFSPSGITRERSFVRMPNHQNHQNLNKRRSLAFNMQQQQQQQQQMRGKPAIEIYRPPSKFIVYPKIIKLWKKFIH